MSAEEDTPAELAAPIPPGAGLLQMDRGMFNELIAELARRGQGRRESGAFLLAPSDAGPDRPVQISGIAYYDDLDPHSLTGGIDFGAAGYSELNALCRARSLRVAADIHTHPRAFVAQSGIDSAHPMIGLRGHVALIAPNYAQGIIEPTDLGVHLYAGGQWLSYFGSDAATALRLTGAPAFTTRLRLNLAAARPDMLARRARELAARVAQKLAGHSRSGKDQSR